jgi:hypothetical protein
VLSDACPGDWLPAPVTLKAQSVPWAPKDRKKARKARWITREGFRACQAGELPPVNSLSRDGGIRDHVELHNLLTRTSKSSSNGGQLYALSSQMLKGVPLLSIYVRATDDNAAWFARLLVELSTFGFGAEASTGKGEFEFSGELEPAEDLETVRNPNAITIVSTFQPGASDPIDGFWESFVKYGKLGPDFGVENVFKRPMLMFRPGALFRVPAPIPFVGRAMAGKEFIATDTYQKLFARAVEVIHPAFGLALPIHCPENRE